MGYILWRNSNESKLQTNFVRRFCPENNIVCCEILKTIIVLVSFFFTEEIFHHTIMYEYINNACVNKSMRLQTFFTIIFMVSLVLSCKFTKTEGHRNPLISTCPGEGPRYGDYKCIHDRTHRVCAKLVDNSDSCNELAWNSNGRSFWDITGQQRWNWKDRICNRPNPGDSWCVCKNFPGLHAMSFDISISKMTPIVIGWMRQCA